MSEPPAFPIIVGVTGHRDVAPAAAPAIRASVRDILETLSREFGDALHVITGLADGADQLVAAEAEALGLNLIAVAPMPRDAYRATLTDESAFDHHWARAVLRLELPVLCDLNAADCAELHYEQLGVLLSRRCHLLLALWDGLLGDARRGGTADVVRMRRDGEHTVAGFRDSPLFQGSAARLDLSPGGPLLQIVTPRTGSEGATQVAGQPVAQPGACFLLPSRNDPPEAVPTAVTAGDVLAGLPRPVLDDFEQITRLNRIIAGFGRTDRRILADQVGYLTVRGVADPPGDPALHIDRLRQWQAAADTAAQSYQRRLLGEYVPARSWRDALANGWKIIRRSRWPHVGVLFWFAATVPFAVALFEAYAHLGRSPWALGLYLAAFAGSAALFRLHVHRHRWQDRFQDYRALAEAMRVQLFWAAAAIPTAASDNYLRKQSGELGWMQFALRGPALWAAALALELGQPLRALVMQGWIEDQRRYFGTKARLHEHAANRGKARAKGFLVAGFGISLVLAGTEAAKLICGVHGHQTTGIWHTVDEAQEWLLVLAATAPAIAAFFTVSVSLRSYEAHAHSYALMRRIFDRAGKVAASSDDATFQAVVNELGREALSENAEWLLDHRHRLIEHQ